MDKLYLTLVFALSLILALYSASASEINLTASIGNARVILYPEIFSGYSTIVNRTILIINPNPIDVKINVSASEEIWQYVKVTDSSFVLKPNESKDASFVITLTEPGRYEGKILVTFLPNTDEENVSGVGLASSLLIIAKPSNSTDAPTNSNTTAYVPISNSSNITGGENTSSPTDNTSDLPKSISFQEMVLPIAIIILLAIVGTVLYLRSGKSKN